MSRSQHVFHAILNLFFQRKINFVLFLISGWRIVLFNDRLHKINITKEWWQQFYQSLANVWQTNLLDSRDWIFFVYKLVLPYLHSTECRCCRLHPTHTKQSANLNIYAFLFGMNLIFYSNISDAWTNCQFKEKA